MWTGDGPDQSWQQALIPEFTKATGIKVTYDSIPEDVLQNKVTGRPGGKVDQLRHVRRA